MGWDFSEQRTILTPPTTIVPHVSTCKFFFVCVAESVIIFFKRSMLTGMLCQSSHPDRLVRVFRFPLLLGRGMYDATGVD